MQPNDRPARYHKGMSLDDLMAYDQLSLMCWHLEVTGSDFDKFCKFMGVGSVYEMTVHQFFKANKAINDKVDKLNRRQRREHKAG